MLYVKTEIRPSRIHGVGLFATEDIPVGALVARYEPGFDREFPSEEVARLPSKVADFVKHFGYTYGSCLRLSLDNSRFTNHSKTPNLVVRDGATYALRDIAIGEELTEDYSTYEPDFVEFENTNARGWSIEDAVGFVRHIQPRCSITGYYTALAGGVIDNENDDGDFSLVVVPAVKWASPILLRAALAACDVRIGEPDEGVQPVYTNEVWPCSYKGRSVEVTVLELAESRRTPR